MTDGRQLHECLLRVIIDTCQHGLDTGRLHVREHDTQHLQLLLLRVLPRTILSFPLFGPSMRPSLILCVCVCVCKCVCVCVCVRVCVCITFELTTGIDSVDAGMEGPCATIPWLDDGFVNLSFTHKKRVTTHSASGTTQ